jgi:hypothetical protein
MRIPQISLDVQVRPFLRLQRLLVVEAEFSSALKVITRQGNTLSDIIRKAWDGGVLSSMTKNSPAKATGAHISIIGHITKPELLKYLTETETGNGFGNRFLWICVRRSKLLPDGATLPESILKTLKTKVDDIVTFAKSVGYMKRDEQASKLWREKYKDLSEGKPGILGAVSGRAEAQVLRIACIYALLGKSEVVQLPHLEAALAVWKYCEDSAAYIFSDKTGNSVADTILEALKVNPLTQTEISELFHRKKSADEIHQALAILSQQSRVRKEEIKKEGVVRPETVWHFVK